MKKRNFINITVIGILFISFNLCFAESLYPQTAIYIDPQGSDHSGDGSENDPFATIQHGINNADPNDTVIISDGTYEESINFYGKAITVASRFILDQDPSHIISTIIRPEGGTVVTFSSNEGNDSQLVGLYITGGDNGIVNAGIYCNEASPVISNCHIAGNKCEAIKLNLSQAQIINNEIHGWPHFPEGPCDAITVNRSGPLIQDNIIYAADPNANISAIYSGPANHSPDFETTIRRNKIIGRISGDFSEVGAQHFIDNNLVISGNGYSAAMNLTRGDSGLVIANNTLIGGSGIWIQDGDGPHIRNNIIAYSYRGIEIWSDFSSIENNNIWRCEEPYSGVENQTGINGNISEDPLFVDTARNNYQIQVGSPCINAGMIEAGGMDLSPTDKSGLPRIVNDTIDMGAFENQSLTGIAEKEDEFQPLVYPNPVSGRVYVEFNNYNKKEIEVEISDLKGKVIYFEAFSHKSTTFQCGIDLTEQSPGIYLLKIKRGKTVNTEKLVLQ